MRTLSSKPLTYELKEKLKEIIYDSSEKIIFGYSINPSKIHIYSNIEKHFTRLNSFNIADNINTICYMKSIECLFVGCKGLINIYKYFNSSIYFIKSILIDNKIENVLKINLIKTNLISICTEKRVQLWLFKTNDEQTKLSKHVSIQNSKSRNFISKMIVEETIFKEELIVNLMNINEDDFQM